MAVGAATHAAYEDETTTLHVRTVGPGYELGMFLGRGGTSVVFEATHPDHAQPFAVKVLVDKRLHTTRAFAAIYEQARAIADLESPHVVRMFDAGRTPSGEPYIVMERLDGEDLAQHIRNRGALPVPDAIKLAVQVCLGLAEVHTKGLVHEDVKPSNIVVTHDAAGEPCAKIIDFGTSIPADRPEERLVTGSPGYASPEQLDGHAVVDGRADIWAVGILIYELVSGRRAFDARTLAEARLASATRPPPMSSPHGPVPPELETIVRCCLEVDRTKRFPTIADVAAALLAIGKPIPVRKTQDPARLAPTVVKSKRRWSPRRAVVLASLGPLCALLTMGAVRLLLEGMHPSPAAVRTPQVRAFVPP